MIICNICGKEVDKYNLSSESHVEICIDCNVKRRAASHEAAENGEIAEYKILSVDEYKRRVACLK